MIGRVANTRLLRAAIMTIAVGAVASFGSITPASAAALLFNDFSDLTGLQLNGSTSSIHGCTGGVGSTCSAVTDLHGHNVLRLTNELSQSGSAFSTSAVSLDQNASFSSAFKFHFTDQQNTGADGIVFVLQTVSNTAGGGGGGIGYSGLTNSVGIEFDNWFNSGIDPSSNHVGIDVNGDVDSVVTSNSIAALDSGDTFTAWVDYDGVNDVLEVRANTTGVRPATALLTYGIDLVQVLGQTDAFVGFTSGTGAAGADHDVLSWQFNSSFNPIEDIGDGTDVPEPAGFLVVCTALLGLGLMTWKRGRAGSQRC